MKIAITPVTVWSATGPKSASVFEVRYINYSGPAAIADCHMLDSASTEVLPVGLVPATAEQCEAWTDDATFCGVLAENAGLTPVEPVVEWVPPAPVPPAPAPVPAE